MPLGSSSGTPSALNCCPQSACLLAWAGSCLQLEAIATSSVVPLPGSQGSNCVDLVVKRTVETQSGWLETRVRCSYEVTHSLFAKAVTARARESFGLRFPVITVHSQQTVYGCCSGS